LFLVLLFAVWMLFLDDFNISRQVVLKNKIEELEQQKTFYQQEIQSDSMLIRTLNSNMDSLEKHAREKYKMKKDHEDVFLVKEK
ncbi:MAG: FtsB family cell division protein, partial [Bacteroidota bacterium]